ncbi:hypothetical protein SUGI_0237660 [Cryptomeria japonica]|uniref:protein CURLY FLAG LEAF 1 n=1 Tax=Cryptomeria japonica TaxID=3369 RepID=UPI002408A64B|nr:protein CURLY FLAG LEAF 1 [Cryptomeria japonica]GLJ14670.1 hypothetical protein SUGI_0237660 [Cryptomeria japonica]
MAVERFEKKPNSWGDDEKKAVELMLGHINNQKKQPTFDLVGRSTKSSPSSPSSSIEFDLLELGQEQFLPSGWEKCLDLKTGEVYYMNSDGLSSKDSSIQNISKFTSIDEEEKVDLKLELSTSNFLKPSRKNTDDNIPEEVDCTMRLVGCPTCLMYFMVPSLDLKCPRCKGSFLLDFHEGD